MTESPQHDVRELGLWWLPGNATKKVAGILTYTPTDGARLELIGVLRGPSDIEPRTPGVITSSEIDGAGNYGRICGTAGGKSFTLEGCFRTHISNLFDPEPGSCTERVHVNRFIRGAEFELGEPVDATGVEVRLLHLPYWIGAGGIAERFYAPGEVPEGEPMISIEAGELADYTVTLDNGMNLSLSERIRTAGDHVTARGLTRDFRLRIEGERLDLEEYLHVMAVLQDLVSMGLSCTATYEEFAFLHPDINREDPNGQTFSITIDFFAQWSNWETRSIEPPKLHRHLFTLTDLGGVDAIRRWCAFALPHRITIARAMGPRYRSGGYVSERLLHRAAALEALDRDTHEQDEIHLRERMLRLAQLAGDPFVSSVPDVDRWATSLKNARNAAAHNFHRSPDESGPKDYWLAETAHYLFLLCLLRHIDADNAAFERIANDGAFKHACAQLNPSGAADSSPTLG